MHEGDHGIMDQTHDELDKKFGHSESEHYGDHHHHHNHRPQSSDRLIKISASILVILLIGLFVVYKFL